MLILCISHIEVIEIIQETDAMFQFYSLGKTNKNKQEKNNTTANKAVIQSFGAC